MPVGRRIVPRQGSFFLRAGATIYLEDLDICYSSFNVSAANEACAKVLFVVFKGDDFLSKETVSPGCSTDVNEDGVTVSISNLSPTKPALVVYNMISGI